MFISQAVGYALHGLTSLSSANGQRMYAADIARSIGASESYLAKTFQALAHAGLVTSMRGMKGGYTLARRTDQITVREVIEAIEGPSALLGNCCAYRNQTDRDCSHCPVMTVIRRSYEQALEELDAMTVEQLAGSVLRQPTSESPGAAAPAGPERHWTDTDEGELIAQAQADSQAFGPLYELHYQRILSYIYRRTLDIAVAEELTSNTFFKALKGLAGYRHRAPFRAWLYRIATNEVRMHWRSRSKRGHSQPSLRWEEELDRLSVQGSEMLDRERLTEKLEEYARLHQSLQALPEKYQAVLVLRYFEDLPVEEIAEATGTRAGTVRSLIHRGLKRLRRILEGKGATFP